MRKTLPFSVAALGLVAATSAAAGEFRGRLVVGGHPAAGVTVSAVPYETPLEAARREARRQPAPRPIASTTSGPDGSFVLVVAADPAGKGFRLRIEGAGVVPVVTTGVYEASESEDVGEETLSPAVKLAGRVVDEKGKPVAGAEVTLRSGAGGGPFGGGPFGGPAADTLRVPRVALTGVDGSFRFDDARAQNNVVTVEAAGYATAEHANLRDGALSRPIVLVPGLSVSGVVRTAGRAPAPGALVRFRGKSESRWVEAGPDGSFRLADLPAGGGTLVADAGDLGMAELRGLTLPEAGAQKLQVTLAAPAAIEGRAIEAKTGSPLRGVKVVGRSGGRLGVARTGADGRYRIAGLLPDRYRIEADDPRYVRYDRAGVVVLAGATEKVDLPLTLGATLSGRVVDEAGKPVANARGRLLPEGEAGGLRGFLRQQRAGGRSSFRTGIDGTFKATRLPPGDGQTLTVDHPEFEARSIGGLSLPAGGTRSGVSVVLARGLSLAGIVSDGEGNPVAGAELLLNQARVFRGGRGGMVAQLNFVGGPENRPRATSGSDGRFEFRGLEKGDYILTARKPGYSEAVLDPAKVGEATEPVELVLGSGASISGIVVDSNGQPAEGYFVQARIRGGGDSPLRGMGGPGGPGREATGPDGFFSVDGLRPGEAYDLLALGPDGPGPRRNGITAPADAVEIVVPATGRIAGRVVEAATGQPVSDFEISVSPDRSGQGGGMVMVMRIAGAGGRRRGQGQREQLHSEDGSFVLDDVPPGTWEVKVDARGYQAGRVSGIVVEPGQGKDGVSVRLSRGSGIRGRVADAASGRAIPDARVTAEVAGGQRRGPMLDLLNGGGGIPTDADGVFEIDGLSQGRYLVSAEHPDYSEATLLVDVKDGLAATELRLQAGGALGGVVMSETRRALPGAQVALEPSGSGGIGPGGFGGGRGGPFGDVKTAVSDAQGRFRFDHLTAGRYRVVASLRERSSPPQDVVLQASEAKDDVQLQIQAGATLRGLVTGLAQAARANVNVTATGPDSYFAATRTGTDGAFALEGVPSGTILLRATAGDFLSGSMRSASTSVAVPDGQPEVQAEIEFEVGHTLSGSVTRGGQPVAAAFVNASLRGGGGGASARSDDSGGYRLEGLAPGSYTLSAQSAQGSARVQQLELEGDLSLDIQIPLARLAGTVIEAGSKQPLADVVVQADSGDAGGAGPRLVRGASTDSTGRFAIEDLEPKAYVVTARRSGFLFEQRQLTAAEQGSDDVVIELQRGEGIGLQAKDGIFGVPLRGLTARVLDAAGASVFMGGVTLDSEGRGEIPSIKPGQYSVTVDASGYAPATLTLGVPAPNVVVALTPGGALEIRAGQATLAGGPVTLQVLDGAGRPYVYSLFGPPGRVVVSTPTRLLENFAPGRYTLVPPGAKPLSATIVEGGRALLDLP